MHLRQLGYKQLSLISLAKNSEPNNPKTIYTKLAIEEIINVGEALISSTVSSV